MLHTPSGNEEDWKPWGISRSWSPVRVLLWFSRQEMTEREVGRLGRYSGGGDDKDGPAWDLDRREGKGEIKDDS